MMTKGTFRAVALILLLVATGVFFYLGQSGGGGSDSTSDLQQIRAAVGWLENLDVDRALPAFESLKPKYPNDPSLAQNDAIASLVRLDGMISKLSDTSRPKEEVQAVREGLREALDDTRGAIDHFDQCSSDDQLAAWMRAKVSLFEASGLPKVIAKSVQRETVDALIDALSKHPDWLILVGPLYNLVEEIDDDSIYNRVAPILASASDANPRNLFVAMKAADILVANEDATAVQLFERTKLLCEPLFPEAEAIAAQLDMTPSAVVDKAISAIKAGDWQEAKLYAGYWVNLFRGSSAEQTDMKLAGPHELDLISFELSRRLGTRWAKANPNQDAPIACEFKLENISKGLGLEGPVLAVRPFDYDLDGTLDLATIIGSELYVLKNTGSGEWSIDSRVTVPEGSRQLIAADLFVVDSSSSERIRWRTTGAAKNVVTKTVNQHDTFQSLIVSGTGGVHIWQANPQADAAEERLLQPAKPTGLESVTEVTASIAADIDADGDLDLVFGTVSDGVQIRINRGNMTFFAIEEHSQLPPKNSPAAGFAIVDFDRDLDLDILTVLRDGSVGLLENLLHLQYRWKPLDLKASSVDEHGSVAVADADMNVSWDPVVAGPSGISMMLTETSDIGLTKTLETVSGPAASQFIVAEVNNDPWSEIVSWSGADLRIDSVNSACVFTRVGTVDAGSTVQWVAAGDFGSDGSVDLAIASNDGLILAVNQVQSGNFLDVRFKGIDDNASGRVNHYGIGSVLELRFGPYYRPQVITDRTTHFGMGEHKEAISLRAILPNGITQSAMSPSANQVVAEKQTLKGSCPYLYAWDGERFAFVTDCLWAAPLGLQVEPGRVVPDRPWEYLKVDGRFVQPREDYYELRITEELWEIAFIDHLRLTAIDHPENVEIFTNEKVGPPSIAQHRVFTFDEEHLQPIRDAIDKFGNDITDTLRIADERYVTGFRKQFRQGLCEPHWIELDLGEVSNDDQLQLVLTGWIFPTDTSLNIQIAQNPELASVVHPVLDVPDGQGGWRRAIDYMGFPGGKTKTIVVDVTGKLNADDTRVRVRTSAQIYWDRAAIAINQEPHETKQHDLKVASAELAYHGFSAQLPRDASQPHRYDYQSVSDEPKWPPLKGNLTNYGDVLDLVSDWDDSMVVMAGGDELRLRFAVPSTPVPDGWKRDFVLHCVGWDKDADLNTLAGQSIGPLPFKSMHAYPPPVSQASIVTQMRQRNADRMRRRQAFRSFWRKP